MVGHDEFGRFYDRQGNRITLEQWVRLIEDLDYKVVAHTHLNGKSVLVSTAWLGIDHNFLHRDGSAPLIFETMIFGIESLGDYQVRYTFEEQALAGHAQAVTLAKTALDLADPGGVDEPTRTQEDHHG